MLNGIRKEAQIAETLIAGLLAQGIAKSIDSQAMRAYYNTKNNKVKIPSKFWIANHYPHLLFKPERVSAIQDIMHTHEMAEQKEYKKKQDLPTLITGKRRLLSKMLHSPMPDEPTFDDIYKRRHIHGQHTNLAVLAQESNYAIKHYKEIPREIQDIRRRTREDEIIKLITGKSLYEDKFTPTDITKLRGLDKVLDFGERTVYPGMAIKASPF